jgi:hypothetical protein
LCLFKELKFNPDRVRMFREATTRRDIEYRVDIIEDGKQGGRPTARKITKTGQAKRAGRRSKVNREGEEEGEEDDAVEQRVCEIVRGWTGVGRMGRKSRRRDTGEPDVSSSNTDEPLVKVM